MNRIASLPVLLALALAAPASPQDTRTPPADYREWVFLTSGLGMNYAAAASTDANPRFDNVFVSRPAWAAFLKTGTWPEKTTFVLEVRASESKGSINQSGHYQSGSATIEMESKQGGKWTFYNSEGKAFPRTERCYSCHAENGAVDNTFVQFYPTLIPVAQQHHTYKAPAAPLSFTEHVLATDLRAGYHLSIFDVNHDGKPDIIALAQNGPDLVWYENPGNSTGAWERHVIVTGLPHMINCAPGDPGPDGVPDIVIAWEFSNDASKSIGKVGLLQHRGDPRQPWKLTQIDAIPASHRIRWADIDGSGRKVAINAPLTGLKAAPPNYAGDHAPLVLYRPGEWKREAIGEANEGVQHGILVTRWNKGDKRDSILTASFSGIDLLQFNAGKWTRTEITKGDPSPCPKCGSSDVAVGYLGAQKFLAAIEPWHGNQVVIYSQKGAAWERSVIDDSLLDGHTVIAADFDGDGRDEVLVSFRQGAKSVYLYKADSSGHWVKQTIDNGGIPGSTCAAADFNGDGALDVACIGGASLKWYENVSAGKKHGGD